MKPGTDLTEYERTQLKLEILENLAKGWTISRACLDAGVHPTTARKWKIDDDDFKEAWDDAMEIGTDSLEDEATRRGRDGYLKPVFQGGHQVGIIREFSDGLLTVMLKARRPDKFRERVSTEHSGNMGGAIAISFIDVVKPVNYDPQVNSEMEDLEDEEAGTVGGTTDGNSYFKQLPQITQEIDDAALAEALGIDDD